MIQLHLAWIYFFIFWFYSFKENIYLPRKKCFKGKLYWFICDRLMGRHGFRFHFFDCLFICLFKKLYVAILKYLKDSIYLFFNYLFFILKKYHKSIIFFLLGANVPQNFRFPVLSPGFKIGTLILWI